MYRRSATPPDVHHVVTKLHFVLYSQCSRMFKLHTRDNLK